MPANSHSTTIRDATSAIRARHRRQVRSRAIRIVIIVLAVSLIGLAVWAVWFSPLFVTRSVEVEGASQVPVDEIIQVAEVPLGTPLVSLDVEAIRTRVLTIPVIAEAEVTREISGVVRLSITESVAVYVIPTNDTYLLVDDSGKGYLTVTARPEGLPVVEIDVDESESSKRLMADAATIVVALPESVLTRMTSMTTDSPDTFSIRLKGGSVILWGSAEESPLKAQVIDGLLNVKASYYDVSSPSHPATR